MNYNDIVYAYGIVNVKQLGNKVIVTDRHYGQAIGYTIDTYNGIYPDTLKDKVYTDLNNTGGSYDRAYDLLFGSPLKGVK